MNNLFNTLVNGLPKPKQSDLDLLAEDKKTALSVQPPNQTMPVTNEIKPEASQPDYTHMPIKQLVNTWKTDNTPETTSAVLKRMQPTIRSAMTSYAPGMDDKLAVKAAKLTLYALKTYDPKFGADPTTHVFHTLKRLNRYGAQASNIIPRSEGFQLEYKKMQAALDRFIDDEGRDPSVQELADLTGFSQKKIQKLMDDNNTVVSESSTLTEDSRKDTLSQSDITDKDYFEYVYASVGPIDQKILEWSSGEHGKPSLSNNQIAAKLHITPAAVSQRKSKIQQLLSDVRTLI